MAKIIFLGSMHDDPGGPERLRRTVDRVKDSNIGGIYFIALEWAKGTHEKLLSLRNTLRQRLENESPGLGSLFIERSSDTLGYEGDFNRIFPKGCRVIWMEDGLEYRDQELSKRDLGQWAIDVKLVNLKTWLLPRIPNYTQLDSAALLREARLVYLEESNRLAEDSSPTQRSEDIRGSIETGRELYMFSKLQSFLSEEKGSDQIGIVIIGAGHLCEDPESLSSLAQQEGYLVDRIWPHQQ